MSLIRFSFDDGPKPLGALTSLTEILKGHHILADFYVNGVEIAASDETRAAVRKLHKAGHKVENHAWTHKSLKPMPIEQVRKEVGDTQALIEKLTGRKPTRLRPPFGAGGFGTPDPELAAVAKEYDLAITLWHVDTRDWESPRGLKPKLDKIMKEVERQKHKPLMDILMHVQSETAKDLELLIGSLKKKGYKFG
jgi:peptidoglycan/xylan/chitin deacetylase (PgdA/CDA1 family)